MITLEEAWEHVRSQLRVLPAAAVPVPDSLGLVVAERVTAGEHVPPFDNSAVDGFAVRSADVAAPGAELELVGTVAAGSDGAVDVGPGQAVRIMTGAPMPPGADAVVMVEDSELRAEDHPPTVRLLATSEAGRHVRPVGDDIRPGDEVIAAGASLTEAHLGLLATLGRRDATVVRRPRVGVLSTGDELVDDGSPLRRGQIRDSNRMTLLACCRSAGFEAVDLGLAPDDESAIERALRDGVGGCDAVLTSGGVSMGEYDYVKAVLDRIGDMRWMQVAIRPAKPFAFGLVDGVPVFGLPGNPVSSQVSFELFARPGIRYMGGHGEDLFRRSVLARAAEDLGRRPDGKVHFVRVRLEQDERLGFRVHSAGRQGSHQVSAMAAADGLAVLPDGDGVLAGDSVRVMLLR